MSKFATGDIVRSLGGNADDRLEGVVKFNTCFAATGSGGKTCDRNKCNHDPKNHTWVKWPNGLLCSYLPHELEIDTQGEEGVLEDMNELLDSEIKEDRNIAADMIKTIMKSRKNQAVFSKEKAETVKNMSSSSKSLLEMMKADGSNAAYRVAAKQINAGIRNGIAEMMKSKGASSAHVEAIAMFLETEWGAAILGTIAGHGLNYVPGIKDDPRVKRLAKEFRISSMTTVGNEVFEMALGNLMPIISSAVSSLPAENIIVQNMEGHKSAVEEIEIDVETDFSPLEDHVEKEEVKRMSANGKN